MSKTILITGASGALGREVVAKATEKGHRVLACGRSMHGPKGVLYKSVDLSDEEAAKELVSDLIKEYERIDAAFLLAGGFAMGNLKETSSVEIDHQFALNFKSAYHVARPLFLHMCEREGGEICLVGARVALQPSSGGFALGYTLAKSTLHTLAKLLEEEGKPKGVRTSLIVPSIIDTPANRSSMPEADFSQWISASAIAEALLLLLEERTNSWRENILKLYHEV